MAEEVGDRCYDLRRGPRLEVFRADPPAPPEPGGDVTTWYINGFPAIVRTWTPEQWAALTHRPDRAQTDATGLRVLLELDPADWRND